MIKEVKYYIFFSLFVVCFFSYNLYTNYKQEKELITQNISHSSTLISEWIESSFKSSDYILRDMVYSIPESALQYPTTNKDEHNRITNYLIDKQKTVPYSNGVGLSDKNCIVTHTLSIIGFDGKNREWCKMLRDYPQKETAVTNMFISNNGDHMVIQARRFKGTNYTGQAGIGVNLKLFADFLRKIELSPKAVISIVDMNQTLLARKPLTEFKLGSKVDSLNLKEFINSNERHLIYTATSAVDNTKRLYSIRKTDNLPFIVVVGESYNTWLENWTNQLVIYFITLIFILIVTWLFLKNYLIVKKQKEELYFEKEKNKQFTLIGSTISYVTHQWKQPLSILSFQLMRLQAFSDKKPDMKIIELKDDIDKMQNNIQFINETLNSIKSFFKVTNSQKNSFNLNTIMEIIVKNLRDEKVLINCNCIDINIYGDENLFTHAIKNIIQNSIDAFISNNVINPKIEIYTQKEYDDFINIIIEDNAGGIKLTQIDKIFEPTITTKASGMGIGLSFSKNIIEEEFKGKITAPNIKDGARFCILIKIKD